MIASCGHAQFDVGTDRVGQVLSDMTKRNIELREAIAILTTEILLRTKSGDIEESGRELARLSLEDDIDERREVSASVWPPVPSACRIFAIHLTQLVAQVSLDLGER